MDDNGSIQADLDAGGDCLLPAGTYIVSAPLRITRDGTVLRGVGWDTKIVAAQPMFALIAVTEGARGVAVKDLELVGQETGESNPTARAIVLGTTPDGQGHSPLTWDAHARVENVHITGPGAGAGFTTGIQTNLGAFCSIADCVIECIVGLSSGYGHGIVCNGRGQKILDNTILAAPGQGRHAIYLTDGPCDCLVSGNHCEGFRGEGITSNTHPGQRIAGIRIVDNTIVNCLQAGQLAALALTNIDDLIVTGNIIRGSAGCGLMTNRCAGGVISGNIIDGCAWHGFLLGDSSDLRVVGNHLANVGRADTGAYGGVEVRSCRTVLVSGNRVAGRARFGSRWNLTDPLPTACQVVDNDFTGCSVQVENELVPNGCWVRKF